MSDALRALQIGDAQRAPGGVRQPRSDRRWWWPGLAATGLVLIAAIGALALRSRPLPVQVVAVTSAAGASSGALSAGGYVHHARVVNVVPRISGIVSSLRVAEDDVVREGDLLATLDDPELALEVAEARAGLRAAQAQLAQLQAGARREEVDEARARADALGVAADRLDRERERSQALADEGALSVQALEQIESASRVSRKTQAAAQAALALLEAGPRPEAIAGARAAVDAARARFARAGERLARAELRAPIAGRVLRKYLDVGAAVSFGLPYVEGYATLAPGSPIVSIGQLEGLEAVADVNQADLGRIASQGKVEVRADAFPDRVYPARVVRFSPRADRARNTVEVTVRLDEPAPAELAHDMSVKLSFLASEAAARRDPELPASAILARDGAQAVFVVEGGRARLRRITAGPATRPGLVPVKGGLVEGEVVVVSRAELLNDGTAVAPVGAPASGGEP